MLKSGTVDVVLTDPPYFDNIAYSELSDFFLPWLQFLDVVPENRSAEQGLRRTLATQGRGAEAASAFGSGLGKALSEVRRVLKANGLVVFTYQHRTAEAWSALATAIKMSNLHVVQVLPMLGNSASGPHVDPGTCQWDAVFVLRKNAPRRSRASGDVMERTTAHWLYWCERLIRNRKPGFKEADQMAFYRACVVGAVGGMFGSTLSESSGKKRLGLSEEHLRSMLKARREDTGSRHSVSGVAVRRVRDLLGLSQRELADRLGVQETTIRHWERGQSRVRPVASAIIRSLDARQGPKARQRRP